MHVIGTAGHVDHGKSTLVRAITGIDPDRLEEEKRRGLTIDLGFAWMQLPGGREVGIVDVPGHERFIRNMLAGVGSIDVTLFVVAANEGWKPQSQEHLDILDILGVSSSVVALTKIDTVDRAGLDGIIDSVRRRLASTALAASPIVPVSATTGEGLEQLVQTLAAVLEQAPPAPDRRRPRLWIDRVFTMTGAGTVVTGTLVEGGLSAGGEIEVLPVGVKARIRSIQSHKKTVERIGPGNRSALNLSGVGTEAIERGDVLVLPGQWTPTRRVGAVVRFLEHLGHEPTERGAFKLYLGSSETPARLRLFPRSDSSFLAAIDLDEPVVADFGDRFVLRDSGRRETLGGGTIIETRLASVGGALLRQTLEARANLDRDEYAATLLKEAGSLGKNDLPRRTGLERLTAAQGAIETAAHYIDAEAFASWRDAILESISQHQLAKPLEPGLPVSMARRVIDDARLFDDVIEILVSEGAIEAADGTLRLPGFRPQLEDVRARSVISNVEAAHPNPPTLSELSAAHGPDLVRALIRQGDLISISQDIVFTPGGLEQIKESVRKLVDRGGSFTVAQFRDEVGTSRKYAIPLLEYLDRSRFTLRSGDTRTLGPTAKL